MGVVAAVLVSAVALAASPVSFVQAHQAADGGFADVGGQVDVSLTAWAVLGLRAAGVDAPDALAYLRDRHDELRSTTDVTLVTLAERSLGDPAEELRARLQRETRPSGQIGPTLNSTYWAVLALGHASPATTRFILGRQARSGGFAWGIGQQPDSNDTAAALQALRVAGVSGKPVDRAVRFLLSFQNRDGGFELSHGRGSDAQSTAWVIQALVAAGRRPPPAAFGYLERLRRPDGSYRYSTSYVATPVWVTSQVLAALAKKPFPLS